ncbi:hypothetical protein QWA68_003720 [Fusarium oxysporum]|nr:hypothetical protein QWA68_003720 [Fusarium oxysporum]
MITEGLAAADARPVSQMIFGMIYQSSSRGRFMVCAQRIGCWRERSKTSKYGSSPHRAIPPDSEPLLENIVRCQNQSQQDLNSSEDIISYHTGHGPCIGLTRTAPLLTSALVPRSEIHQTPRTRVCFDFQAGKNNTDFYVLSVVPNFRGAQSKSAQAEAAQDAFSTGVLVVLQQIEDWSTGEVPETVKAGKRKLQEGFTTATKIKKPRTLDSTDENQRSKLELARRKVKPRPKAETTITTPTWSKRRNRGFPGGAGSAGGAGDPSKLTTHDAWYLSCVVSLEAPNCEARDPCIT